MDSPPQNTGTVADRRPATRFGLSSRTALLLLSLTTFLAGTSLALYQPPRPDPLQPVRWLSPDWWRHPVERNAFRRLPVIGAELRDVAVLGDGQRLWAVGSDGMIVHSADGGQIWQRQSVGSADCPDRTPDDPASPIQQSPPGPDAEVDLSAVVMMEDGLRGWIMGDRGTILHTRDGGACWRLQTSGGPDLRAAWFLTDGRGWAVGDGGTVLHRSGAADPWRPQPSYTGADLRSVQVLPDGRGWAVGDGGTVLYTTNGGAQWQQYQASAAWLFAAQFLSDGRRGWAAGSEATLLRTDDGGETWRQGNVPRSAGAPYLGVRFLPDGRRGWAVGMAGAILHTADGGDNWQAQASPTRHSLTAVAFLDDGLRGWAVGAGGTILHTNDGGESWRLQTAGTDNRLRAVEFLPDGRRGWAAGPGILATTDGGTTWTMRFRVREIPLYALQFSADGRRGWAVGDDGMILGTADGGSTWSVMYQNEEISLSAVGFPGDGQRGWAVGTSGIILHTADGGETWHTQVSGTTAALNALWFLPDGRRGWAVGDGGAILATADGGTTWQPQTAGTDNRLRAVEFLDDGRRGWAVGDGGVILATADGGATWQTRTSGAAVDLNAVQILPDGRRGWAVGDGGVILATADGGTSWQPQAGGSGARLNAVQFLPDGRRGWAVGDGGVILATADGGTSWRPQALHYARYPAPWLYLVWLLSLGLLLGALRRPPAEAKPQRSIADMLASDRPLAAGEPDALDLGAIARGLSLFLRNENTQPPLTLAVTGEWGTGKSSLMNLLRAELRAKGVRPIWFNAWHHQKEEHLLASLLENIRLQAIPSLASLEGWSFRVRLAAIRGRRHWLGMPLLVLVASALALWLAADFSGRLRALTDLLNAVAGALSGKPASAEPGAPGGIVADLTNLGLVLAALATLAKLWMTLKPFGVDPAVLATQMAGRFRIRDRQAQTGFRHRFAREFEDVTAALQPRTMLILIDDLDRCHPDNVLEVLEAVNFLVSSGQCYIVLGMARDRVERCIGLAFKDVAAELLDAPGAADEGDNRRQRADYARHYLEKLINIEVPIPAAGSEQSRRLLDPRSGAAPDRWRDALRRSVPAVSVGLALALGVAAGYLLSWNLPAAVQPPPGAVVDMAGEPPPAPAEPVIAAAAPVAETAPRPGRDRAAYFAPAPPNAASPWTAFWPLGLLLLGGLVVVLRPRRYVESDAPEFTTALNIWHPVIVARRNTPRDIKRYLNRVRYLAMRLRGQRQRPDVELPPDMLVALSAVQQSAPEWLTDPGFAELAQADFYSCYFAEAGTVDADDTARAGKNHGSNGDIAGIIEQAIAEHQQRLGHWPPTNVQRDLFLAISAGVHSA